MPPVPPDLPSMTVAEVDWFFTAEQEMSSDQLKFKVRAGAWVRWGGPTADLGDTCEGQQQCQQQCTSW